MWLGCKKIELTFFYCGKVPLTTQPSTKTSTNMSATEPKKARTLTPEQKAKMAAGRTAAAVRRAAEKATQKPVEKPAEKPAEKPVEKPVEKPAPTDEAKEKRLAAYRAKRELEKAEHEKKVAERREVKTKALMIEAVAPLNYYKKVLAAVEAIDGVKRDEILAYFNDKIEDLEADVSGKARYAYVLAVKEDNGDEDWSYTKVFKTSQQVSAFVAQAVTNWTGDYDDSEEPEDTLPTAESIDARLENAEYEREIHLYSYGEPYVSCISFNLNRNRMN